MNDHELLSLLLPAGLLEYFDVTKISSQPESYTIYIEERNLPPEGYNHKRFQSKGFNAPITIQDFPLRGKACYLKVKRRRWVSMDTGDIISRDWNVVAKGTRLTAEFASFLKALDRY